MLSAFTVDSQSMPGAVVGWTCGQRGTGKVSR
ncbi:MAG: hypothetical protein AVDCRST_MAG33-3485 [uncultured Thermomicrobiales bacterium]|uniref:Uncharacterized protein n=1 Tax=uncultured Thermomicrobiales bacterium TaxID=1645740 RepID=A0A6J4VPX5_9BACT|nr:MAG: hypothetical protein AVDCRST_MAG33-3485 [uncultured Thermomicrobiales bacterium]